MIKLSSPFTINNPITVASSELVSIKQFFSDDPKHSDIQIFFLDANGAVVDTKQIVLSGSDHDDFMNSGYNTYKGTLSYLEKKFDLPAGTLTQNMTEAQAAAQFVDTPADLSQMPDNLSNPVPAEAPTAMVDESGLKE